MAIVFPNKKKLPDNFAPRKAIQDAKNIIGSAYFDPALLECSKNAVELTKLVHKWDEIDKERHKVLRDIDREQRLLARSALHSFASSRKNEKHTKSNVDFIATKEGIETLDGTVVTPGFRYTSQGEVKPSSTALPLCHLDSDDDEKCGDRPSSSLEYDGIDYDREINELQTVLYDICSELTKNKIKNGPQRQQTTRTYLRAHSTDYSPTTTSLTHDQSPNSRFAFKPGSSVRLHQKDVHTPSHRTCLGCQFKLKQHCENLTKLRKKEGTNAVLNRRWSYVPTGKYVQSSTTLASMTSISQSLTMFKYVPESTASLHKRKSALTCRSADLASSISLNKQRLSVVHFKTDDTDTSKNTTVTKKYDKERKTSLQLKTRIKCTSAPCPSELYSRSSTRSVASARGARGGSRAGSGFELACGRSIDSRPSSRSNSLGAPRSVSSLVTDYDARLSFLKDFQADKDAECNEKVHNFLKSLPT
ncbi:uncharacterized protein LOC128215095 [Mya arenaria]|uniref:uncharacterized protein LOC128215095 n=1 Tax=Mya arenaria TaxID=6604 RepID=UPI0022E4579F|nr:uncharacterized protein LOC128215095 [Mya arenaria]